MSTETNKAALRRLYEELFNKKSLAVIDELYAADYIDHSMPPGLPPGPAGIKLFIGVFFAAFSDMNFTVENMIAEGDMVAARGTVRATHTGEFQGLPPTGKQVTVPSLDFVRCNADGKFAEHWAVVTR